MGLNFSLGRNATCLIVNRSVFVGHCGTGRRGTICPSNGYSFRACAGSIVVRIRDLSRMGGITGNNMRDCARF